MAQTGQEPGDRPLMPLWALVPLFGLVVTGNVIGATVAAPHVPMSVRIGAAAAGWLGPLAAVAVSRAWINRLDEFQRALVMQAVGWAGVWTVLYLVGMIFYNTLTGIGQPLPFIGSAPGLMAFAAGLMLAFQERRARRATREARE